MIARLPKQFEEHDTLEELPVGHYGYTVPWAMSVDEDGGCWLNPRSRYRDEPNGTVTMRVAHTPEGYVVTPSDWFKYRPGEVKSPDLIPVAEIKTP